MKLKDVKSVVVDKVCIYTCVSREGDVYKNLYLGMLCDAPHELLERELGVIGAKAGGLLDIEVR